MVSFAANLTAILSLQICVTSTGIAANTSPYAIGISQTDICHISLYCIDCGLKVPTTLIQSKGKFLFCTEGMAFPFAGPVSKPVCAICSLAIVPDVGLFKSPPGSGAGAPPGVDDMER